MTRVSTSEIKDGGDEASPVAEAYGSTLMNAGLVIPCMYGDFHSVLYLIKEKK